ncbi:MAG: hypothetical protein QNJ15_01900 [Erythrobacter sp.]|nr:hypothetical protein [Erythrobacter sp.]
MRQSFEYAVHLDCDPGLVWAQVLRPALFLHVAAPLVQFRPIGIERFPQQWSDGEYRGAMRLFGIVPLGWQAIVIELPDRESETRTLIDNGYSPLLPLWNHRISIRPENDGTRYTDDVSFDAGLLTPLTGLFVRLFFRHRQRRLRALSANGFAALSD